MIKWSNNFSVKHKGIDEQHKKLIGIIENVVSLIRDENGDFSHLIEVVNELDIYVEKHFQYEEALMKTYSYPEATEHVAQHNELRDKMANLNLFSIEKIPDFYSDILTYLVDWLSKHIMQTDKKLGAFLEGI